jgi:ABC-type phosphate transport system substrate-binding protein
MSMLILMMTLGTLAGEPVVVVSPSTEVKSLTRKEARQIFTLRKTTWKNGLPIRMLLPPRNSTEMTWLSEDVLGLPADVYQRFLAEQAYRSGDTIPPRATATEVAAAITEAGDSVGVVSVVSTPIEPPTVQVTVQ